MGANEKGLLTGPAIALPPGTMGPATIPLSPGAARGEGAAAPSAAPHRKTGAAGPFAVGSAAGRRATTRSIDSKMALGALLGLLAGAAAGFLVATARNSEQIESINQAAELRLSAANQRIQELQEQQRAFAEQADKQQQEVVAQADEQQRKILSQVGAQENALLAQQRAAAELARQREQELAKPDLPVKVWVKKALLGGGLVGQIHNFGTKQLSISLTMHSVKTGQQYAWSTVVAPNATQVVGNDPGWRLVPGDELQLNADGYRLLDFPVAPNAKTPQPQH
jgi:hypothetical protein